MPLLRSVKVIPSGGSLRITLPSSWTKTNKIEGGMELQALGETIIVIFPPSVNPKLEIDKLLNDIRGALNFLKK